jgi:LmbE family N-acetylglucosaminyl deacetylase
MDLRRAEDRAATAVVGAAPEHLPLPEAPHRGYGSAAALFAEVRPDDLVWQDVRTALRAVEADLWLAPQGLGGHVDHLQVVRAVAALGRPTLWWRDAPYALRQPDAAPSPGPARRPAPAVAAAGPGPAQRRLRLLRHAAGLPVRRGGGHARRAAGLARAPARRPGRRGGRAARGGCGGTVSG